MVILGRHLTASCKNAKTKGIQATDVIHPESILQGKKLMPLDSNIPLIHIHSKWLIEQKRSNFKGMFTQLIFSVYFFQFEI